MQRARVFVVAAALSSALCAAGPKVDIRVIPRPRVEDEDEAAGEGPASLLTPSRDPFPVSEGPFTDEQGLPCFREERATEPGKSYIFDLCLLANATLEVIVEDEGVEEVELDVTGDVSGSLDAKKEHVTAELDKGPTAEKAKPERTMLGIFRGWHIDPITLSYEYMIFDDGDECMDGDRKYSITVELIPSSNPESSTKLYGLKSTGMCTFEASLLTFVPDEDRVARQGIHTPGVVDISSAEAALPVICGKMKCRYEKIAKRVYDLSVQIRDVQDILAGESSKAVSLFTNMTLEASKNTLEFAAQIVQKSVELFHDVEVLQQSLSNDWLGREEAAKREIAQQEAEDEKRKLAQNVAEGASAAAVTVEEQEQVVAES